MVSCIICSRKSDLSDELKTNIADTIGVDYELVVIDNSHNQYSIFSAYNEGVKRAKGNILCFMHEDILYHTRNWGNNVLEYFNKYPQAGLLGVAGTHYLANVPSAQWDSELSSSYMIQGYLIGKKYTKKLCIQDEYRATPTLMAAVDGLWMCMPSVLFNKLSWDTSTFNGFHAYDTDMAMQVWNIGYEVHLCWDVLIEHSSMGDVNKQFDIACDKLYDKWKSILPMIKGITLTYKEQLLCNKLVECKMLYRKQLLDYQKLLYSRSYNIGKKIIKPFKVMNIVLKEVKKGGVDVILITYNQEKYVAQAVESILMQQMINDIQVRVIIADDCSKDSTLEIIKSYEEKSPYPFIYLNYEHNLGVAANYKRAFNATEAEFVAILEGDDFWNDKCRLQKHLDYLSSHTECVMTKNNYLVYSQKNKDWVVEQATESFYTLRKALVNYELANMSCTVFRGNIVRTMDERVYDYGHKQWKEATDWYTHLYVLQRGYCYIFEDVMSVYRVDTGDNISRTKRSNDDILQKANICYELSLDLLGESYKKECLTRYNDAKIHTGTDKQNVMYQKYSDYISPYIVRLCVYKLPKLYWWIKYVIRQFIPNKLYKLVKI